MNTYRDSQLNFLTALFKATQKQLLIWRGDEASDNRDRFIGEFKKLNLVLQVEFIYFMRNDDEGFERFGVRIQANDYYQQYAVGTEGYDIILAMLTLCMFGWKDGTETSLQKINALTEEILN